jgi:hypothetical protein
MQVHKIYSKHHAIQTTTHNRAIRQQAHLNASIRRGYRFAILIQLSA